MFLDRWQYVINEIEGKRYGSNGEGIPVFTYEEIAGLVLGYDPWDLGLQMHQTDCKSVLDKIGIDYDPDTKYQISGEIKKVKEHNFINV
jgi:heterodisulfide reductase subunit B